MIFVMAILTCEFKPRINERYKRERKGQAEGLSFGRGETRGRE
jgi:hypothetical protein